MPSAPDERSRRRSTPKRAAARQGSRLAPGILLSSRGRRGDQPTLPLDAGEQAVAVVLDLVHPFGSSSLVLQWRAGASGRRASDPCVHRRCSDGRVLAGAPVGGAGSPPPSPGSSARPSPDRRRSRRATGRWRRCRDGPRPRRRRSAAPPLRRVPCQQPIFPPLSGGYPPIRTKAQLPRNFAFEGELTTPWYAARGPDQAGSRFRDPTA